MQNNQKLRIMAYDTPWRWWPICWRANSSDERKISSQRRWNSSKSVSCRSKSMGNRGNCLFQISFRWTITGKHIRNLYFGYRRKAREGTISSKQNWKYNLWKTRVRMSFTRNVRIWNLIVYVDNPEQLSRTQLEVTRILKNYRVMKADNLFQKMEIPLLQVVRVVKMMLGLSVVSSVLVITFAFVYVDESQKERNSNLCESWKNKSRFVYADYFGMLFSIWIFYNNSSLYWR